MGDFLSWAGWGWITIFACAVGLVAAMSFVVAYQVQVGWDWWHNPYGRYLMTRKALLAGLFVVILLNRFIPGWPARLFVTAVLMSLFALQTFVPYRLLMRVQHGADHEDTGGITEMSDPTTAGPNLDGSKSLARESKLGHAVTIVASAAAFGVVDALGGLDLSALPGWAVATATAGVATLCGLLTSWATRNRAKALDTSRLR
jgi:hypothetical protein